VRRGARIKLHLPGPDGKVVPVGTNLTLTFNTIAGHLGNSPH